MIALKLQISTDIKPLTVLGRLISLIFREGKAIEGHKVIITADIMALDEEAQTMLDVVLELRTSDEHSAYTKVEKMDLYTTEAFIDWPLYLPISGIHEFRVFILNLDDEDVLLDEDGVECTYFATRNYPERYVPPNTRYYVKLLKIYSLFDLLLFLFAGASMIGAVFEVLNFFLK